MLLLVFRILRFNSKKSEQGNKAMKEVSDQVIELLSKSILLSIPQECMEGVKKNTQVLTQYSQLIHQFEIPDIKEKE